MKQLITNQTYFVVQRFEDWQTHRRYVFSGGEKAYISVILFLYVCLLVFSTYKLSNGLYLALTSSFEFSRIVMVLLLFEIFSVFRVVLFVILITETIVDVPSGGLYVLIEFPILLYFVYVTNFLILWSYVIKATQSMTIDPTFLRTSALLTVGLNLFISGLFITIIILYQYVIADPVLTCSGQIVSWNSSGAYVIGLVYRCVFGGINICVAIAFARIGYGFYSLLNDKNYANRVLAITLVSTFGLFAQGIVWIIFPALNENQSNYLSLSLLIVVEIIPTTGFLVMTPEQKMASTAETQKGNAGTDGSKSASKTGGSKTGSKVGSKVGTGTGTKD